MIEAMTTTTAQATDRETIAILIEEMRSASAYLLDATKRLAPQDRWAVEVQVACFAELIKAYAPKEG